MQSERLSRSSLSHLLVVSSHSQKGAFDDHLPKRHVSFDLIADRGSVRGCDLSLDSLQGFELEDTP